jgi:succinate dehydrogenase assembly factor 1
MSSKLPKHSGLQKQVIQLYRDCFRQVKQKPIENRENFRIFIRREFNKHDLMKKDFVTIEYLVRKGKKQLELLGASNINNIQI